MQPLRRNPNAIVLVPAPRHAARRRQMALTWRVASLLPALVATPQRALFTAGVAFGLASPRVLRFLAGRALGGTLRSLVGPQSTVPTASDEVVIEHFSATRIIRRKSRG